MCYPYEYIWALDPCPPVEVAHPLRAHDGGMHRDGRMPKRVALITDAAGN